MPLTNDVGLSGDEIDPFGSVLLCILGKVNGIKVTFLIDSGASECFISTTFVKKNKIKTVKAKEKLRIQLADWAMRVSNFIIEQACVEFKEHMEFLNFSVIPLLKYEAIMEKPWLDRWNLVMNWKRNSLVLKMGKRKVIVQGVQDPQGPEMISSLFQKNFAVEMILVQQMRRLSRKEPIYLAMIRTTNDTENEDTATDSSGIDPIKQCTVIVNDDRTQTRYPREVQVILDDYADVFP